MYAAEKTRYRLKERYPDAKQIRSATEVLSLPTTVHVKIAIIIADIPIKIPEDAMYQAYSQKDVFGVSMKPCANASTRST